MIISLFTKLKHLCQNRATIEKPWYTKRSGIKNCLIFYLERLGEGERVILIILVTNFFIWNVRFLS